MSENQALFLDCDAELEDTLEAMIFMSKDPLTPERMVDFLQNSDQAVPLGQIKRALKNLMARWDYPERTVGTGLMLKKVASGYIFCTGLKQATVVKLLTDARPVELSKAQIEVLSIVAYRQPITRVDVDEIRGVDSTPAIKRLMQLKLLKILGKSEGLGRPLLYGTTKHFLEFFALNSLNDLPTLKQFESLGSQEELQNLDLLDPKVSLVDILKDNNSAMFSEEVEQQSLDALKGLDEAMLRIEDTKV